MNTNMHVCGKLAGTNYGRQGLELSVEPFVQ